MFKTVYSINGKVREIYSKSETQIWNWFFEAIENGFKIAIYKNDKLFLGKEDF